MSDLNKIFFFWESVKDQYYRYMVFRSNLAYLWNNVRNKTWGKCFCLHSMSCRILPLFSGFVRILNSVNMYWTTTVCQALFRVRYMLHSVDAYPNWINSKREPVHRLVVCKMRALRSQGKGRARRTVLVQGGAAEMSAKTWREWKSQSYVILVRSWHSNGKKSLRVATIVLRLKLGNFWGQRHPSLKKFFFAKLIAVILQEPCENVCFT